MTRRTPYRIAIFVLFATLVVDMGRDGASSIVPRPSSALAAPQAFAMPAFESTWRRTDDLVASGQVKRTWFWGPTPSTAGLSEEYKQGAGSKRLVQYFDKSRMEINNPSADPTSPWYVTNGLLTVELISGRVQTGDNSFTQRAPATINVTGDAGDGVAPTYASFSAVSNASGERRDPDRTGQDVTATLDRAGKVGQDAGKAGVPGSRIAYYEKLTGHNIPEAIWAFLNASGPVEVGGRTVQQRLIDPWFYASGLPISDPYWAKASIAGKLTDVLVQAYERRVLTYVPSNPEGFCVEMGNVGQHYYQWRYSDQQPTPAPTQPPAPVPTLSRFAVDLNGDTSPKTLDGAAGAGIGAARIGVAWSEIEPNNVSPAQYNWGGLDNRLKRLADKGISPIVLLDGCPNWACTFPGGPIRVEHVGDFVEFMSAMAAHYGRAPYNTHYWEFWNEPDAFSGEQNRYLWGTHPDRYADMLKAIRPGMKDADPNAKLIMGGIAYDNFQEDGGPFNRNFVDGFLSAGGGQYLDYFNFHYYVQNIHWCSLTAKLNELRAKLAAHNVDVPIITSETGFTSSRDHQSDPDTQSLYVAQTYAQALGERMSSVAWFAAKDFQTDVPGWQLFKDSGLMDINGNFKPSYQAYKTAVAALGQRSPVRALAASDGVSAPMRGYEFASDASHPGALWALWAWDLSVYGLCGSNPPARDFAIPPSKAPKVSRVLDMYGQPISTSTRADGSLVFSLDARPVYVEWR